MAIAVLGWGSLICEPGELPLIGDWRSTGPFLPIEFARESQDGRMTLVIVDGIGLSQSLWAKLEVESLMAAREKLAFREKANLAGIGTWPPIGPQKPYAGTIGTWAQRAGISGVVWTALQPGFRETRGAAPSLPATLAHLRGLTGEEKSNAVAYIADAPTQVQTPFRPALEKALGIVMPE